MSSNYLSSVSHLDRKYTDTIVLHINSDVVTLDFEMDVSATNRWPVTEDFFFFTSEFIVLLVVYLGDIYGWPTQSQKNENDKSESGWPLLWCQ